MHTLNLLWSAHNEEMFIKRRKRGSYRDYMEIINQMPETLFMERFRLDKVTYQALCQELRETSLKGTAEIPVELKVMCALSFLATGSYQRIVGVCHHLPQRSVSRSIKQVIEALNHRAIVANWIVFPKTREERSIIEQKFQTNFGLPGVIGCIDCTHISIVKPREEEHLYFNSKKYCSLNVQVICDSDLRITNVDAKFGGATHDSHIWSSSRVESYMRELHQNNEQVWLLGDSEYPQRPWLMTPIQNADKGSREEFYNQRHEKARNSVQQCIGLLKARWRCMLKDKVLHYHPHVASQITMACCILHNIALKAGLPPLSDPLPDEDDDMSIPIPRSTADSHEETEGRAMLNSLISKLE